MKKIIVIVGLTAAFLAVMHAQSQARAYHHRHHVVDSNKPADCPSRWCGCWLSKQIFGTNRRDLWAAIAWLKFPHTNPKPGAVAVMRHHVGIVTAIDANGNPVIKSGNHRHRVGVGVYPAKRIIAYVEPAQVIER